MDPVRRARILVVDDSAVVRSLLRSVICADAKLELVGSAADGESALGIIESLRPDLILLDVEMPIMDGLVTLRKLRLRNYRMPVIMCSSLTQRGAAVTIEALASGASDYVAKPAGQANLAAAVRSLSLELIPKIYALTGIVAPAPAPAPAAAAPRPVLAPALQPLPPKAAPTNACPSIVVIGVSTGGPAALDVLLPSLPASFPLPVVIVQHMPELFTQLLAERLGRRCALRVIEAPEGAPARPGAVYIARGNWHLELRAPGRAGQSAILHLSQCEPENHCRPSVDVLFRSAAAIYGAGVLAVMLTGMGSDGLAGTRIIRAQGGTVLAQDQATSSVWGMPGAVARAGLVHRVLPLPAIASEIIRLAARTESEARELRETAAS